ncbi:MAG: ABC transporter substrate-binding protein [Terrimicrobiaceae bacterium]|jgi:multiple sugar transport system substrate-binding protein|nr:ABC transporter substrate-binding protein [Terrimicrobiaceae bacterium]
MNDLRGWLKLGCGVALALAACQRHSPRDVRGLELRVLMEPDGRGAWRELFAEFERRNPDVRVAMIEGPAAADAREDMYIHSLLAGSGDYDLVYADVVWIPKFAAAGWLEDLTDRWPQAEWKDFVPATIEGGTYKGRIYRVPTQLNGGVLYYRKDLLEGIGAAPPGTFGELEALAKRLQVPGQRSGFVWQGRQYEGLTCNFLEVLGGFGGVWIRENTREVGLDRPEAERALTFLCRSVGTISPPGVTTYAEEESRLLFLSGGAVFLRNWPYVSNLLADPETPRAGEIGIAPMPAEEGRQPAATFGGAGFSIVRTSPNREAAWRLIEFVSSPFAVEFLNARAGLQPPRKSFYAGSGDPRQKALFEALQYTVPRPALPQYAQASDILQRYVSAALTGQLAPGEALRRAAAETRALLKGTP